MDPLVGGSRGFKVPLVGPAALVGPPQPAAPASPPAAATAAATDAASTSSATTEQLEQARLVSSALSDDGMTPLIQPALSRKEKLLLFCKRLLSFVLSHWSKALILACLITLIVLVSVKGFGFFGTALAWFQRHNGWAGWGIFVGMYTLVVALFLPGVVLILGAGFVFGFWRGLLAVWAGGAVGQALAFLLARYLLQEWVESTLKQKWKKWTIIDKAIEQDGWKLVLIMRFSPIIPYNLLNIAMATTSIPFWQFTVVSAVGIIYECAVFAYFGSMADNIHSLVSGQGGPPPVFEWVMLGVSAVMCILGAVLVSHSIRRAVQRAQEHLSSTELDGWGFHEAEDLETAVQLHPSYLTSLRREGFLGNNAPLPSHTIPYALVSSPRAEFELKTVVNAEMAMGDKSEGTSSFFHSDGSSTLPAAVLPQTASTFGDASNGRSKLTASSQHKRVPEAAVLK